MKFKQIISSLLFLELMVGGQLYAQNTPIQTNVPALKEVYSNDFYIGCLLSYKHVGFASDPKVSGQSSVISATGGELIRYHMNSMTPGNNMKSVYTIDISASAGAYSSATTTEEKDSIETHPKVRFNGDLIAQLNWAKRQGFTFRGHTLVWHNQSPAEFFRSGYKSNGVRLSKEVMTQRMENYIKEVIRIIHENWPGMFSAIDVVNESVSDSNGAFRTSNNEYYTTFGDQTFVMKAFEFARKYTQQYGETQIKLYYNDYSTSNSAKADGIVRLCKPIFEAGLLDGIGMQEHDSNTNPTAQAWINSYNKFDAVCNEMAVTELDVSTNSGTNTPSDVILETQANQYAALFKCFVERSYFSGRGKIINVSKDGLNDQYTFVTNQSSSLWDSNNQCKPSFYAVADVGYKYNKLDSLVSVAEKLYQYDYPNYVWDLISSTLIAAKNALSKNYSASVSAVDGLSKAFADLEYALNVDFSSVDTYISTVSIKAFGGYIHIGNLKKGSRITVYNLNGALLQKQNAESTSISIPCSIPCIVRVINDEEVNIKKVIQ
jgi:GH35 family endo-1,4-beta-xylanase